MASPDSAARTTISTAAGAAQAALAEAWAHRRAHAADWSPPDGPVLVVVPHPDDEALATGGLLARLATHGATVRVLAVTDGEAAYADRDAARLAERRGHEQRAALAELGHRPTVVQRCHLPDGNVAGHEDALRREIERLADGCALVVAPWTGDHHCDHEAAGRAAVVALRHHPVTLLQSLFWAWSRSIPDGTAMVGLALTPAERCARRRAVHAHRSQVSTLLHPHPVLQPDDLRPLDWSREYYLVGSA